MTTKKTYLLLLSAVMLLLAGCSKENLMQETEPTSKPTETGASDFVPSTKNDSLALVAMYNALDGANWKFSKWTRTPLRYWEGVELTIIEGQERVTSVKLYGDKLKGELPSEVRMLTELRKLVVAQSDFVKGSIIDEVFELKKLNILDFQFTGLTGELSPRIGELTDLDTLSLWKGRFEASEPGAGVNWDKNTVLFSGSIPAEIGNLTKLRFLNFARAGFQGEIPASIGNLASITRLDLSENRLSGAIPSSIGKLQKVEWLALCNNQLTGNIPNEICNAAALQFLSVSDNKLTGAVPAQIGNLPELRDLRFENNQITGSLPTSLENSEKLGLLYGGNNKLSGTIPAQLGLRHPWLVQIHLENNNIEGSLPEIVGNDTPSGTWICLFYVAGNRLTGDVPAALMNFPESARKTVLPQQNGYGFDNLK